MSDNARVSFKRGTQAALNTLIDGSGNRFTEGTFYLTNDTNRLYFAQADNKLVDLNQYIHILDESLTSLPKRSTSGYANLQKGDIYYWSVQNILAICEDPVNGEWVQLNADTYLVANSGNAISVTSSGNSYTFDFGVTDSKNNMVSGDFTLTAGSNVTLNANGRNITISSENDNDDTHYALGTSAVNNGVQVDLTASNVTGAQSSSVVIKGDVDVSVTRNNAGEIIISGASGLTGIANSFDNAGAFTTSVSTSTGSIVSTDITPTITYGDLGGSSAVFANGTAALSVYTKAEVDTKIANEKKAFNAMEYAGVLQPAAAADLLVATLVTGETPKVGTTYKAGDSINVNGVVAKAGDLIIAEGTDGNVTWSVIPSGDDQLISTLANGNGFYVADNSITMGGIVVNGGTNTNGTITATPSISDGINTITITHGAAGTGTAETFTAVNSASTQADATNRLLDIPTIVGLSKDAAGHVTSVTTKTFRIQDTHANIKSVTIGAAASNNVATITTSVSDTDDISDMADYRITSNNLIITSSINNNVPEVNIDMVWGSF